MSATAPTVHTGAELEDISTEHLGFRALAQGSEGPKKLKLLPTPWPTDNIPSPSATLLAVASKPGLIAAAGPDTLVITTTEKVRKAFDNKAGEWDVISDFAPDVSIQLGNPPLRHVAFSADGDFLVISAEGRGGLAVFDTAAVMKGKKTPEQQIATDDVALRALLPNPVPALEQYMATVLESGKLCITDVSNGSTNIVKSGGVTCATWSTRGKAVLAGLEDGTVEIYLTEGQLKGTIPRPPDVDDNYEVTGLTWLKNQEMLIVHSPKASAAIDDPDSKYHMVESNKTWTEFTFRPAPYDPLLIAPAVPNRALPPRFSALRLQKWAPDLEDMLIITSSHTDTIGMLTNASKPLSSTQTQDQCNTWTMTTPEDTRRPAVPMMVFGDDGDSVLIGEALDLSATEKILRPVPTLEEINEAPWPLPAYLALTHQGVLSAWWIVWDRSVEKNMRYPGLVSGSEDTTVPASPAPAPTNESTTPASRPAPSSMFAKSAATFGSPSVPQFGATGLGSTPPFLGKPAPAFGSTTPAPAKPAAPAFGAPSTIGAPKAVSGFGAVGGMGNKASPWASSAQTQASPFAATAGTSSPFAAAAGNSSPFAAAAGTSSPFGAAAGNTSGGFAKFGQPGGSFTSSSFGSTSNSQSGFGSLGQNQQKSSFPGLKTEPSAGSTITLGSGTGSSLPSWANTPAQGGSVFGQKSSFDTSSFGSRDSEVSERKRDEATPTPQAAPQAAKGLSGLAGGFQLGTTFKKDGSSNEDPAKPAAPSTGSFFQSDFATGLGGPSFDSLKAPTTPAKDASKDTAQNVSTTPASPPRQQKSLFSAPTPAKDSATPKAAPPVEKPVKTEDAPLPPDFLTTKPPQPADDELPPLAGSPGVKVEAPSSSVEASPLHDEDDEDDDFSVEEDSEDGEEGEESEEGDEAEEPSPSEALRKPQSAKSGGWNFQDSVNQTPQMFPPAPTPPVARYGAPPGATPAQPSLFGQASKPQGSSLLFGEQPQKAPSPLGFGNNNQAGTTAKPFLPPPTNRVHAGLRSPSPVRSASTSALRTRREPIDTQGQSLSASIQQPKQKPAEAQVADLDDEEDQRMREQLSRPIEPSKDLDEFVAYQNYTGKSPNKTGHAAQIEMLYKDINGMVDTLGWNSRSIKSFTKFHEQPQAGHEVDRQTLEEIEDEGEDGQWFDKWVLSEISSLKTLEDELEQDLDAGRVQDVLEKLSHLGRLLHDKAKLMTRLNDIRRQIINRKDPDKADALRKAPLSKEAADTQKNLRHEYARLLTLMSQAEESTILLRSRLASHNAQNGKTEAVPTVDAVKKTIVKMISLAENRNNEITLIESQLRKVGLADQKRPSSSSSRTLGTPRRSRGTSLRNSVAESPFATPPTNRSKMSLSELSRRALTPDVDTTPTANKGYGLNYGREDSAASNNLARMSDMVDENIDSLRETARRRKQVAIGLKKALVERGAKTTKFA